MTKFLYLDGYIRVPKEHLMEAGNLLIERGILHLFRAATDSGHLVLQPVPETLSPGEETEVLDLLELLGQRHPGQIVAHFEVWWPMVVDSGPQWWHLDDDGKVYVTESEIVRGDKKQYKKETA